jgi:Co/Zn/Cd efflux system component
VCRPLMSLLGARGRGTAGAIDIWTLEAYHTPQAPTEDGVCPKRASFNEIAAGVAAGSASLQADALDFLGDAANYGISLSVAGMMLAWRARAALAKGVTLFALGLWVLGTTVAHAYFGTLPHADVMGIVGTLALLTNGGVAAMLYRFRGGDANMRSVWICAVMMQLAT